MTDSGLSSSSTSSSISLGVGVGVGAGAFSPLPPSMLHQVDLGALQDHKVKALIEFISSR